jgi:hypothetical protein
MIRHCQQEEHDSAEDQQGLAELSYVDKEEIPAFDN